MLNPIPKRPRTCTHIKVTGQRCGSPALRGEFFCYFHTRVIKGVQQRVDMRLHSMALLEDCESIQLSIMHVVDGLVKGMLDPTRARLIIQALRIAARNAKNVRFDDVHYRPSEQPMVREVPNYAHQYLIEHPEFGPPLSSCGADTPVREAKAAVAPCEAQPAPIAAQPGTPQETRSSEPASPRRRHADHGVSRETEPESNPAPLERQNLRHPATENDPVGDSKEHELIKQAEAAIPGAMAGNWRDLRTVFEFAGIAEPGKEAPS